jgi:hypothetical protein
MKTAALGHAASCRRCGGVRIKGVTLAFQNRNTLEPTSEGMRGEQARDAPANDHTMTIWAGTQDPNYLRATSRRMSFTGTW